MGSFCFFVSGLKGDDGFATNRRVNGLFRIGIGIKNMKVIILHILVG
jgi:hypothetical protein